MRNQQITWLGHALRRETSDPSRRFALYEPKPKHGTARPGKPAMSYHQYIVGQFTSATDDIQASKIEAWAQNKNEWKKRVYDSLLRL